MVNNAENNLQDYDFRWLMMDNKLIVVRGNQPTVRNGELDKPIYLHSCDNRLS